MVQDGEGLLAVRTREGPRRDREGAAEQELRAGGEGRLEEGHGGSVAHLRGERAAVLAEEAAPERTAAADAPATGTASAGGDQHDDRGEEPA